MVTPTRIGDRVTGTGIDSDSKPDGLRQPDLDLIDQTDRHVWLGMEPLEPRVLMSTVDPGSALTDHHDHTPVIVEDHHDDEPTDPHPDDPDKQDEHLALLSLVEHEDATHRSINDGAWSSTSTWADVTGDGIGDLPTTDANVLIHADTTVLFDLLSSTTLRTIRVDGTLDFATDINTRVMVDTFVVSPIGTLNIGSESNPVAADVNAVIVIADRGEIDTDWDPHQLSRGLISHGTTNIYGTAKTGFVALAEAPRRGDTVLELAETPVNWQAGDRIVLTGTHNRKNQNEEFEILSISGNQITVDALKYHHLTPVDDLSVYVANVTRNVVVISENPFENGRRGHAMFMHSPDVEIHNAGFYGLGRTDKRNHIDDPLFDDDGELIEGSGQNVRGRYAAHFHRNSPGSEDPAVITGSAVVDSPGWGFVNHDSYVIMEDNVSFDVVGAHFVTEDGNERGVFRGNIAIRSEGSGDGLESREEIHDLGHGGHGFWFQGGGIEVVDNVAAGHPDAAFIYFTRSAVAEFDVANLPDAEWAHGITGESIPVGSVPILKFENNEAFASHTGLETWFHLLNAKHDGESVFDGFTAWNMRSRAAFIPYTNQTALTNFRGVGNLDKASGTGIGRNNVTRNIDFFNVNLEGWKVGIDVPRNGITNIEGGYLNNVKNISITTSRSDHREVHIGSEIEFGTMTDRQSRGQQQYDVFMQASFNIKDRDLTRLFNPDIVRLGLIKYAGKQVYYHEQAGNFVPFPADGSADYVPDELIGKDNATIWNEYGIAIGGAVAPSIVETDARINGLIGDPADYPPNLQLRSRKYTNRLEGYRLVYSGEDGVKIRDTERVDLREGWNLITREIDGHTRTFMVYGDVTAPEFVADPERPLVLNPLAMKKGFTVRGVVLDDSFGVKKFKKKFKGSDLAKLEVQTRADGSQFILLEFRVKDRAGNFTEVQLELTLDENAPLNPLGKQKNLPPRQISPTLEALLQRYLDIDSTV